MSLKLDGKKLSLEIEGRLTDYISSNKIIAKRAPGLAVIRIGEDPASGVYVNNKEKACSRVGIKSFIFHLNDGVEQKEIEGFSFFETNIKTPELISISVKVKNQEKISAIFKGEIRSNL